MFQIYVVQFRGGLPTRTCHTLEDAIKSGMATTCLQTTQSFPFRSEMRPAPFDVSGRHGEILWTWEMRQ